MYDWEGNFTAIKHVEKFDDFIDIEVVDYEYFKMRLFAQILSGEAKKWFGDFPSGSIRTFQAFQKAFLERWDDNKIPL